MKTLQVIWAAILIFFLAAIFLIIGLVDDGIFEDL
jgi:hypothetical protein